MAYYRLYGNWPAACRGPFRGIDDRGKMGDSGFPEAFAKAIEELVAERPGKTPGIGEALVRIRAIGVDAKAPELCPIYWEALGRALGRDRKKLPHSSVNGNPLVGQSFWNVRGREVWYRLKHRYGRCPSEVEYCRALGAGKRFGKLLYRGERVNQWIEDGRRIPAKAV